MLDDFIEFGDEFVDGLGLLFVGLLVLFVTGLGSGGGSLSVEHRALLELADIDGAEGGNGARTAAGFVVQGVGVNPDVVADVERDFLEHGGDDLVKVALVRNRDGLLQHPVAVAGGVENQADLGETEVVLGADADGKLGDGRGFEVFGGI